MTFEHMTSDIDSPARRGFLLTGAAFVVALPLAACQSTGSGGGASARESFAAASRLASLRKANGLSPLATDRGLETAALRQAGYMADAGLMEHRTGWGKDFVSRMKQVDTGGTAAENIAHGRFDVARVLDVWMDSPPHRRNMMDPRFSRFGLAYVSDGSSPAQRYWAMVLGS